MNPLMPPGCKLSSARHMPDTFGHCTTPQTKEMMTARPLPALRGFKGSLHVGLSRYTPVLARGALLESEQDGTLMHL